MQSVFIWPYFSNFELKCVCLPSLFNILLLISCSSQAVNNCTLTLTNSTYVVYHKGLTLNKSLDTKQVFYTSIYITMYNLAGIFQTFYKYNSFTASKLKYATSYL
jgi:hypothetical protein